MSSQPAFRFAVVCEAPADQETACDLADRVICEAVDWVGPEDLESYRCWRGFEPGTTHVTWKGIPARARTLGIKFPHGHFDDGPGKADAKAARRAIWLFLDLDPPPDAIMLIRDTDRAEDRFEGLKQASREASNHMKIVVGVARTKRECWVLNGFDPRDETERRSLANERRKLGFDPRTHAHKLTAEGKKGDKNAKRVLRALVGDHHDRQRRCWTETSLDKLRTRGEKTDLRAYLGDVGCRLIPLFCRARNGAAASGGQKRRARRKRK